MTFLYAYNINNRRNSEHIPSLNPNESTGISKLVDLEQRKRSNHSKSYNRNYIINRNAIHNQASFQVTAKLDG